MNHGEIRFTAKILRKQEDLPRYVVVKSRYIGDRSSAFVADVMLNDAGPFSRNIRPWGKGSDAFIFNLTAPQCKKAKLETSDECTVTIIPRD